MPKALRGRYRLKSVLGRGGFGVVYLAEDRELSRLVAIKLAHEVPGSLRFERLQREGPDLARVQDPHVVSIYDSGSEGATAYLVMEYLPGETLDVLPPEDLEAALLDLSRGLEAIHQAGLIHRDLKPSNVMLVEGRPVILDFGLAFEPDRTRLTRGDSLVGSLAYMAPEVLLGGTATRESDWYSLGASFYQLLHGSPWQSMAVVEAWVAGQRPEPPLDPGLSPGWRAFLKACLSFDPDRRPRSQAEVSALLRGPKNPDSSSARASQPPTWVQLLGPVLLGLGVGWFGWAGGGFLGGGGQEPPARESALAKDASLRIEKALAKLQPTPFVRDRDPRRETQALKRQLHGVLVAGSNASAPLAWRRLFLELEGLFELANSEDPGHSVCPLARFRAPLDDLHFASENLFVLGQVHSSQKREQSPLVQGLPHELLPQFRARLAETRKLMIEKAVLAQIPREGCPEGRRLLRGLALRWPLVALPGEFAAARARVEAEAELLGPATQSFLRLGSMPSHDLDLAERLGLRCEERTEHLKLGRDRLLAAAREDFPGGKQLWAEMAGLVLRKWLNGHYVCSHRLDPESNLWIDEVYQVWKMVAEEAPLVSYRQLSIILTWGHLMQFGGLMGDRLVLPDGSSSLMGKLEERLF